MLPRLFHLHSFNLVEQTFIATRSDGDPRVSVSNRSSERAARTVAQTVVSPATATATATPASETARAERRRRRRRRRSRDSIVGLPIYSEDPVDSELTLVKHRTSHETQSLFAASSINLLVYDPELNNDFQSNSPDLTLPLSRIRTTGTLASSHSDVNLSLSPSLPDSPIQRRSRSSTIASSHYSITPSLQSPIYGLRGESTVDVTISSDSRPPRHVTALSNPINSVMSASRPVAGRSLAATFRSIFARPQEAAPLRPRASTSAGGLSPYGQLDTIGSRSIASVAGLSISSPLPSSLVRSDFVFPKSGLTPLQIAFISSKESLGAYGYGPGESPPSFPFDLTTGQMDDAPIRGITRPGRSASVTPSPLRTVVTHAAIEIEELVTNASRRAGSLLCIINSPDAASIIPLPPPESASASPSSDAETLMVALEDDHASDNDGEEEFNSLTPSAQSDYCDSYFSHTSSSASFATATE